MKQKSWKAKVMTLDEMRRKLEMNGKKMTKEWEEKMKRKKKNETKLERK